MSILLVLLFHLPALGPMLAVFPYTLSNSGWLGVEVFFILSGYVITNALARDRYEPLSFLVKRVFRLTPALLCFFALATAVFALFVSGGVAEADVARVHQVTKASAALGPARANGWNEERAWHTGFANRPWDEIEAGWVREAVDKGAPTDEAVAAARSARAAGEARWRAKAWEEYGWQCLSVLGGYYNLRTTFVPFVPRVINLLAMWSLVVEDNFYLAVGLVCLALAVGLRRAAPRVVPWVLGGLSLALYLSVAAVRFDYAVSGDYWGFVRHPTWYGQLTEAAVSPTPFPGQVYARAGFYLVDLRFEFVTLGVLAAYFDRRFRPWVRAKLADRGPFLAWPLLLAPIALGAAAGIAEPNSYNIGWLYLVAGWCYTPLVVIAAHNQMLPAVRGRLAGLLHYLGDRSYAVYLLHFPLLPLGWYLLNVLPALVVDDVRPWAGWLNKPHAGRQELLQSVVVLVLTLLLAEVVHRLVELPLTRLGRRLGGKVRIIPAEKPAAPADG